MIRTSKSIIGYPGGKSKAADLICSFIPAGTERILSPFFGGGSVEFLAASRGIEVFGYDAFEPLINFWQHCKHYREELAAEVERIYNFAPMDAERFATLKEECLNTRRKVSEAAIFFILNKTSFSAFTLSGVFSAEKAAAGINAGQIRDYCAPNVYTSDGDYRNTIPKAFDDLIYADPPYDMKRKIYGVNGDMHRDFDHAEFRDVITKEKNWIVSYNDTPQIRELFKDYHMETPKWKYNVRATVPGAERSNELLIFSEAVWARHMNESLLVFCEAR